MTVDDLKSLAAEVRELAEKATPGEWCVCIGSGGCICTALSASVDGKAVIVADFCADWMLKEGCATEDHRPDMRFIAHARTAAPKLAEGLLELAERLRDAEDVLKSLRPGVYEHEVLTVDGRRGEEVIATALARIAAPVEVGNG